MKRAFLLTCLFAGAIACADHRNIDQGLVGFSGQVQGVVEGKHERGIVFRVSKVVRTWKNNEARMPKLLEGKSVPVGPSWHKVEGRWRPSEPHVRFLRSLRAGERLTLELKHAEHEHFAILELDAEQRKRAGVGREREEQVEGDRGKDAQIRRLQEEIERLKAENRELRNRR